MANELQMNIDANESCWRPRVIWQLFKSLINTAKLRTCRRCSKQASEEQGSPEPQACITMTLMLNGTNSTFLLRKKEGPVSFKRRRFFGR